MNITPVPQTPGHIKGSNQLAWERSFPVIDLRSKFGFQEATHTKRNMHNSS